MPPGLNVNCEQLGEILALLLVISFVFETALMPIFNWRLFARFCEGRVASQWAGSEVAVEWPVRATAPRVAA